MTEGRRFAVVTGASSGIGNELARILASENFDLLITAEDFELEEVRTELQASGTDVEAVRTDLTTEEGVSLLAGRIQATGRPVDLLALNAGIGAGGAFATDTPLEQELRIVDLNIRSVVRMTKMMLPLMLDRGEGRILLTSSIASTMPGAFQAVYNASKSFVQSFGLALQNEIKDSERHDHPVDAGTDRHRVLRTREHARHEGRCR